MKIKKLLAIAAACTIILGSSVMAYASSDYHSGNVSNETGGFHTYIEYEYEEGVWCDVTFYSTSVNYNNYPYKFDFNRKDDHHDTLGREYWNVTYDDRDRGTAEVTTYIDTYGDVEDYLVW